MPYALFDRHISPPPQPALSYPSFRRRTDRVTCRCGREEALSFAAGTCGYSGRGVESGGAKISAGQASPFPGFAGSVWVRHASRDDACPRKVRKRFSDKAHAKKLCSEAVSAPEGGRPPPKNAWGRAKAKPHKHNTPEATRSRGSPDFKLSSPRWRSMRVFWRGTSPLAKRRPEA